MSHRSHTPTDPKALRTALCGYVSTILKSCEKCLPLFDPEEDDADALQRLGGQVMNLVSRHHLDLAGSLVADEHCPERSFLIADAAQDLADYAQTALLSLKLGIRGPTPLGWKPRRLHLGLVEGDRAAAVGEFVDERLELLMTDLGER